MSASNLTKALRTLGLAAALMSPLLAQGARAEGTSPFDGKAAYAAFDEAGQSAPRGAAPSYGATEQNFLERSGATGGNGQHS
jgi:hypothetical protein